MNIKLKERCEVLENLVASIYNVYSDATIDQKRFIQTMLGAAIWYLPHSEIKYWTGNISEQALENLKQNPKTKLTKEHQFPRKIAAQKILSFFGKKKNWDTPFIELYEKEFALFNYVTPTENKKLAKHQTEDKFETIEKAYENANIKLIHIDNVELKKYRKKKI